MVMTVLWMGTMLSNMVCCQHQTLQELCKAIAVCTLLKRHILRTFDSFLGKSVQHQRYVQGLTPRHQHGMSLLPSQQGTCTALLPPSAGSGLLSADTLHGMSHTDHIMMLSAVLHMINHSVAYSFRVPALQAPLSSLSVCAQGRWLIRVSVRDATMRCRALPCHPSPSSCTDRRSPRPRR